MINEAARAKYFQSKTSQGQVANVFNAMAEAVDIKKENKEILAVTNQTNSRILILLEKIGSALPIINKAIPRSFTLPKIFQVKGSVAIENDLKIKNLGDLERYFKEISVQIKMLAQAISSVPQPKFEPKISIPATQIDLEPLRQAILAMPRPEKSQKIEFPKIDLPKQEKIDLEPLLEAVQNLESALGKKTDGDSVAVLRNVQKGIEALVNRPVMTPQPVTNVNINALQGFTKTTTTTVGTSPISIPGYGQLFNRRSLIVYNNSSNTIYIGGSDVTTSNGLPIPTQTFSPSIDAGYNMIVYAVSGSTNNDIRVLEVSKDQTQNVQE